MQGNKIDPKFLIEAEVISENIEDNLSLSQKTLSV
jgi:hypothetical protein